MPYGENSEKGNILAACEEWIFQKNSYKIIKGHYCKQIQHHIMHFSRKQTVFVQKSLFCQQKFRGFCSLAEVLLLTKKTSLCHKEIKNKRT